MAVHFIAKNERSILDELLGSSSIKEKALRTLEAVHLTRYSDEKMGKLVRQNKGGTFQMPVTGHELIGAVSGLSLIPGTDWGFPYYRDRAFAIGLGCSIEELFTVFLA